jgi:flagellar secretion chaperone FliS
MSSFGVHAYRKVAVEAGVAEAGPHQLVLMLFDGAIEALRQAEGHLAAGRIGDKGVALGKACRILEEGLKASIDRNAGGELARQLHQLYEYMTLRALQGHLRNDARALQEVARLLGELRSAWAQIGRGATQAPPAPAARARGDRAAALAL